MIFNLAVIFFYLSSCLYVYISFLCIQCLYLFPCTDKTIFWEPNEGLASIKGPYMPPYNCIPGSTLITFVVYIAVRLLYAYRVFNVFKQLKHPPINPQVPVLALFATTRK